MLVHTLSFFFFFFNDTATTEIYTLSLHDALPIFFDALTRIDTERGADLRGRGFSAAGAVGPGHEVIAAQTRSEEHTSELQSQSNLVCRLLLEKKKKKNHRYSHTRTYNICVRYSCT